MKEIRFRAWDIENKVMCDVSHIFIANMVIPQTIMVSVGSEMKHCPDDAILMQFTGLHDKNFQEIYEGDIIQRVWNPIEIPHPIIIRDFVEYRGGCFILSNRTTLLRTSMPNIEVIGNIYEHPELLKEA